MEKELIGYLSGGSELVGMLSDNGKLYGELSIPDRLGTPYEGPWEVTPDSIFQLLPTAETYCDDDILVHPIPYAETTNFTGGYTATIGG